MKQGMGAAKEFKYFLILKLLTFPAYHFLHLYAKTLSITFEGDEPVLHHLEQGGKVLFACWHQRFFGGFYFPKIYRLEPCIMISRSRDGDFIAAVVRRIGWKPVRGSSSRGGRQALAQMIEAMEKQKVGAHIVDGPLGPPRMIKPGLISIAQKAGAVISLAYVVYEKPWIFNSWDRFMIPRPFSRVHIAFSAPADVPAELGEKEFEDFRRKIETEMIERYQELERYWGK